MSFAFNIDELVGKTPVLKDVINLKEVVWYNELACESNDMNKSSDNKSLCTSKRYSYTDMLDAENRWHRFARAIEVLFPETVSTHGIIESELKEISTVKEKLEDEFSLNINGRLFLKCDNDLPVAGSVKARGGMYEVLKHAETLAMEHGMLKETDDYSIMASDEFRNFYSQYSVAVGSTGNLGISIGMTASKLGFKTTVHMSSDAKQWKKDMLRANDVNVVEYETDYSQAVSEGRKLSQLDDKCYFIDDENSIDLFMGYSVAAIRLKKQLEELNIKVDENNPLFVYIPCGVGGAPGGICFGLNEVFGKNVHVFFAEPTHSPCMLVGMSTGLNEKICVQDLGIDNKTQADGLAVGRASGFVGSVIKNILRGEYTIDDSRLNSLLTMVYQNESIKVEPSATPGIIGPFKTYDYIKNVKENSDIQSCTYIAWATGGRLVPENIFLSFLC